jgi:ABC-type bacteriocin/lantibiotic exporter with double-glycine peptidase domain
MSQSVAREYERQAAADIKQRVDAQVRELGEGRWSLLRMLRTPSARLVRAYFRPMALRVAGLALLGFVASGLEAVRLVLFIVLLKLLVGEDQVSGGTVNALGIDVPLPFVSDLTEEGGLLVLLLLVLGLTLVREGLDFSLNFLAVRIQSEFMFQVRRDLLDKLLTLESAYFAETKAGDIAYLQNTVAGRFATLVPVLRGLLSTVLDFAIAVALLALISPYLTLILLGLAAVFFLAAGTLRGRARALSFDSEESSRLAATHFLEMVHGIRLVKLGGQERRVRDSYLGLSRRLITDVMRLFTYQTFTGSVTRIGSLLVLLAIAVGLGIFADLGPSENVAVGLAYLYIAYRALNNVATIADTRIRLSTMVPQVVMVADFLLDQSYVERAGQAQLPHVRSIDRRIAADGVRFGYTPQRLVLDGVSLEFSKGTITALVGASGAGKTTLLELLAGFRTPSGGRIVVDDADLAERDLASYRELVGYVTQDTVIFHDTLLENVRFLRPEATPEEVERAVDLAAARELIESGERGLETMVGERGLKVSGGQRQRIALARVLLQDPPVLLLDEATNALDLQTEAQVYDNLLKIKRDKIVVVAAHRLSAITRFERIVVLHEGRILESGSHAELMAAKGLYFHLFSLQEYAPDRELGELL